jgi:hypothetical protein
MIIVYTLIFILERLYVFYVDVRFWILNNMVKLEMKKNLKIGSIRIY